MPLTRPLAAAAPARMMNSRLWQQNVKMEGMNGVNVNEKVSQALMNF